MATDWLSTLTLPIIASILTAMFTGLVAYIEARKFYAPPLFAEWNDGVWSEFTCTLQCTVYNNFNSTLYIHLVKISGPVTSVLSAERDKHHSWADDKAPVRLEIPAGQSRSFPVTFSLDFPKAKHSSSSLRFKPRLWAAMLLWQLFSVRLQAGFKVLIVAVAYTRRSTWRPRRITHSIRINEHTIKLIEQNATKAGAASGD